MINDIRFTTINALIEIAIGILDAIQIKVSLKQDI